MKHDLASLDDLGFAVNDDAFGAMNSFMRPKAASSKPAGRGHAPKARSSFHPLWMPCQHHEPLISLGFPKT
ncbi:MAG TPA: hypothetical protein PLH50_07420 [Ottowia beijingensis]|nr:hypothetical protein [Ottowia beijingensis]